ncbi:MAG TPA: LacI family transcriptional regulator [Lachnoclostridium phytofermentans]|uniref:LacI family transcriptional regulator n=1 Tax=Lachnoclostridium phytofermentans TaxID=66219 RepID=A0A3D2X5F5_9FIRM|nr:LacI family DNA-binding transcriptional regulator [Lachnoclostridium sp.]HCL01947.1 LacI family transcriptional regulator [Lachnoclostridium phytofermentans]
MKVTIKDIAREAGVSVAAVSLVLNHKDCRIAEDTKKRILKVAEKYNYTVNQQARSLVTKKSNVIGLIIPDIENIFFSSLSKKIEEYCRKKGYAMMIVNTDENPMADIELLHLLVSRGVDGILYTPSIGTKEDYQKIKTYLETIPIPYVMVDRYLDDINCNKVYIDNINGSMQAISMLVKSGHTKIGCIGYAVSKSATNSRVTGYIEAMKQFNLPVDEKYIYDGQYKMIGGYNAGKEIVKTDLTAVYSCNDMMTLGFLRCLSECGKKVPEDYSIISYDNTLHNFVVTPKITTIDQDLGKLARNSCRLLFKNINDEAGDPEVICLYPQLLINESVKKLNN